MEKTKRRGLVRYSACVLALTAASCAPAVPTGQSGVPAAAEGEVAAGATADVGYGVVPTPPLPVAVPPVPFNPSQSIADHDGSVVVTAAAGRVSFAEAAGEQVVSTAARSAELRAVSVDGRMAALFAQPTSDASRITVIDRGSDDPLVTSYDLPGLVEPEAFSTDGTLLYVIDHEVAKAEGAYRVRPLNLTTGRLETIVGPSKVPLIEDMNGVGRRQLWAPDGTRLYTLYIRQTHHHHHRESEGHTHGEPGTDAFVHVLDLVEEWAFCLDLPSEFGGGELETTALALAPDGETVAVADGAAGRIAFASTVTFEVTEVFPLTDIPRNGSLQLGLTEDGVALAGERSISWFARDTMAALGSKPIAVQGRITGFTPTGDGLLVWSENLQRGPVLVSPPT